MRESDWVFVIGCIAILLAIFAYKKPELFLKTSRHKLSTALWIRLLGEDGTVKLVRYFSVPLAMLIGIAMIAYGVAGFLGYTF